MSKPIDSSPTRPHLRTAGLILWPAFVAAALATGVFFTLIDPLALAAISWPAVASSRITGYSLGFFMFWAVASLASAITWLMLRPTPPPPARMDDEQWD
ncbi:hypothetical protein ABB30_06990 [Stenotrophomonas ginsengisoli]|uniref:Transmembrane protein n=1 Tax=Stenotrophomonas ginsengisoli TaxID=336566 RepID=A0A0R0DHI0_9GAMM|nr:hypothetical protein [Stenotrophomonas ginsengisoli]KRG77569.1 hypothetical protein ABB30_06990 [Stenotrophomonas ginsengisoli]